MSQHSIFETWVVTDGNCDQSAGFRFSEEAVGIRGTLDALALDAAQGGLMYQCDRAWLERFAALVAAQERAACVSAIQGERVEVVHETGQAYNNAISHASQALARRGNGVERETVVDQLVRQTMALAKELRDAGFASGKASGEKLQDGFEATRESVPWDALDAMVRSLARLAVHADAAPTRSDAYQARVQAWMLACFGSDVSDDRLERSHRFLEEALELGQACGATQQDAHALVDYVFGRPVGEVAQEVGGVMVSLAALCGAARVTLQEAADTELARVWTKVAALRAKHAGKPKASPLPGPTTVG